MRNWKYILPIFLLFFVCSAYKTGRQLPVVFGGVTVYGHYEPCASHNKRIAGPSVGISKPRLKVRFRGSEVKLDLCDVAVFKLPRVFYELPEFFEHYSFDCVYFHRSARLRGPPVYYC